MVKICIICGREFEPRYHQQKTCSDACSKARANQRRKHYPRDRFPWSKYRHAYYVRNREKVYEQTYRRRNMNRPRLCISACRDYLAHLEETYGYTDDGTIRKAIMDWSERRNCYENRSYRR